MYKNYLKIAYRNLLKYKGHTIINIVGLGIGICAVMLIYLYVSFENSYDNFIKDSQKIYRVSVINEIKDKGTSESSEFVDVLAPAIKSDIPEVTQCARVSADKGGLLSYNDKNIQTNFVRFADSTFFDIFAYDLIKNDSRNLLNKPFTAVLTADVAEMLFGKLNAVGQVVKFNEAQYEVTGVTANPPLNTHLRFNVLLSFSSLYKMPGIYMGWNGGNQYITYVKLNNIDQPEIVNKKLVGLMRENLNQKLEPYGWKFTAYLQPLSDIHLKYDDEKQSRLTNIYVFSAIALFILLIACINYINLTISSSLKRSKEIGLRKTFGAGKIVLIKQFVTEFFLMIVVASAISIIALFLILPYYKNFIGEYFNTGILINGISIVRFIIGVVFISFAASLYPAFYLSRLTPLNAINENRIQRASPLNLRNALILLQFVISIGMISATLIISSQLSFIKNRDAGFKKDNILVLSLGGNKSRAKYITIKNEISKIAGVEKVTASSAIPRNGFTSNGYTVEGQPAPDLINVVDVDKDFLDTYKIKLVKGRNFSEEFGTDKNSYIVNEEFVKKYNLGNPLGKFVNRNSSHKIIGVVSDFNFASAYEKITPLIITNEPESGSYNYLSIGITSQNIEQIINSISKVYKSISPDDPIEYTFLDESLAQVYRDEENFRTLFFYFASLSIIISIIGLLGLTTFSLRQKRKELGIRKVLGASVVSIIKLFYTEYLVILLIAVVIASTLTLYFMNSWLEGFAYRITPSFLLFIFAGLIAVAVSFVTVSFYTIKAARSNPVESLRYE